MSILESLSHEVAGSAIARGIVVRVDGARVTVAFEDDRSPEVACEVLQPAAGHPVSLAPGDSVLVWRATEESLSGVVLGRIGPALVSEQQAPDELLIEAKHTLTLRVGDGSITIRADGKILIKGKDLVSHAARTNRIKGGSVQIN